MKAHVLTLLAALAAAPALAGPVQTLPSGVKVETLAAGKGDKPKASDTVKVNYRGTLIDGKEFDSSARNGGPISFALNRVIPCWTQGVATMQVGGKAKLSCPANTAYGARGVPGVIPPNSPLVFEVELLAIEK
ncbi:FKBP-type peptidylprolyl isomerase [Xenophilus sp. AP218F]|nr:FKBP-type peptidyl-prolyl cis-trans isomerase [Chromobacterium sp. ASV5]OWY40713.1 FKBP-type peptidylprolyl isomerase [Xenophilus sp. AP218F]